MSDAETPDLKPPTPPENAMFRFWAMFKPEHKKLALRAVTAGLITYLISLEMTTYSGTTLLFPESWREIAIGLASLLGILMFEMGHVKREKHLKVDEDGNEHLTKRVRRRVWVCFFALLLAVSAFVLLRGLCVYQFDATKWLTTQARANHYFLTHQSGSGEDAQSSNATPAADREPDKTATPAPDWTPGPKDFPKAPEFVNVEQQLICLPLWLPPDDQQFVEHIAQTEHVNGIRAILDEQPGLIINWLTSDARMNMNATTLVFLLNYLLIIGLATYLLGVRFDPVQSLWEAVLHRG
jgi:hypothetical protein